MEVRDIEVVEDRTDGSRCDEGFLRVRRLRVRNVYADGTRSATYDCDVVSRASIDAVAVVLYEVDAARRIRVVLRDGVRPAVFLRKHKNLVVDDAAPYLTIVEMAAGVLEPHDTADDGVEQRAAAEAVEECGLDVDASRVARLGGEMFPSPGVGDEKVFFRSATVAVDEARAPEGDGSVMEEATRPVVFDLDDAITQCRRGEIPDMKTELALLRLADQLGYVAQLGMFVDELPRELRDRYRRLGVEGPGG